MQYLDFLDSHDIKRNGNINDARINRRDVIVPFDTFKPVADVIQTRLSSVFSEEDTEDRNGYLMELSSLITLPGTKAQRWHVDCPGTYLNALERIDPSKDVSLYSVALSLHDVNSKNGTFNAIPGSFDDCPRRKQNSTEFPSEKGDVVIWNNRVCHRGGEHVGKGVGGATARTTLMYSVLYNTEELPTRCSSVSIEEGKTGQQLVNRTFLD